MKQLIQNLKTGAVQLEEIPTPQVSRGQVLIQTRRSLVSLGTERMLVEFGRASLINKARQQPDRVKQVIEKIQSDGLLPTLEAVCRKLNEPLPLGYCNVGTVLAVGDGVTDLKIGDRVVSNGHHAEVVCVPRNLVALIPAEVSDDEAAFTVVGAIGLQSIRLLAPTLGETVVVVGLGLLGQLTAELLRINGCRVIGVDINETKCRLAARSCVAVINPAHGTDPVSAVLALTNGAGADGVIIAASAPADQLLSQAARMSRKRGKIILSGVVDLAIKRADFYEKELSFQVSCAYGPGRYEADYEQRGQDYPLAHVRWTANRNFQAILQVLVTGQLQVKPYITQTVPLIEYDKIYGCLDSSEQIAALLTYPDQLALPSVRILRPYLHEPGRATVGIIGAGNFTGAVLLPVLKAAGADLRVIASAGGLRSTLLARKFNIPLSTTDCRQVLNDPAIDLCIITTRHDSHAQLALEALQAGKHVFVEKPLAIYADELTRLIEQQQASGRILMVGFNRRFSPFVQRMKALLGGERAGTIPMNIVVTVNAGAVPATSWLHDRNSGGGRILSEACHFVDLISFLAGSSINSVCLNAMGSQPSETSDSASMLLRLSNGSTGVVNYFSNGSKAYSKERVEVYAQGQTLVLDNFRSLTGYGVKGFRRLVGRQNKGHTELIKHLIGALRSGQSGDAAPESAGVSLIPFAEIINTTQTMLAALESLHENRFVDVVGMGVSRPTPLSTH
ncbi:bi-domain-containing oxidoreductase [Spirosoma sp.]|uniref:bi-domain-containing oxidoreductase n=1 Tax=Spirosoma sp. TaxID=1899569 RepID=UPI00260E1FF6|nr:bi-domain-containing oxidoreductase [Spirosoma sp.]MCX6218391.1 bi-domain-containing oxidoreductase [Spirosoma sp.]